MRYAGVILVAVTAVLVSAEGKDPEKFTPEFLQMLQSVLARLKVKKADLSNLGFSARSDLDVRSSTTTETPTVPTHGIDLGETYCDKDSPLNFLKYCKDPRMQTGVYVDPWDPYCGFIQCHEGGNATRHYCEKGSWTGFKATSQGRQAMCRRSLKLAEGGRCIMTTFNYMCRNAEWVVDYNNKAQIV